MDSKQKFLEQSEKVIKALFEGAKKHDMQVFLYGYIRTSEGPVYNETHNIIMENNITHLDGLLIRDYIEQYLYNGGSDDE